MPAEIEIDVFSGRPNPRVPLDDAAAAQLRTALAGLVPAEPAPAADGLGYRGVRVTGALPGGDEILAHAGTLTVTGPDGRRTCFGDPGRGTERRLLRAATRRLPVDASELCAFLEQLIPEG